MDIENLWDVWQAGGRLYARCEKPRREGLKSVRPCSNQYELDVRTLLWTRGRAFPISMLSREPVVSSVLQDQHVVRREADLGTVADRRRRGGRIVEGVE